MADDSHDALVSRRDVLKRVGIAGAVAAVPIDALAQATREPFETLSATEGATLEAIVARLIPTDANGPGATEARAARYIDRALGGVLASSRDAYRAGLAAPRRYARAARKHVVRAALAAAIRTPCSTELETNAATGFAGAAILLQPRARAHDSGHVRRSVLRRQRELRRLGSDRLSRRPPRCRRPTISAWTSRPPRRTVGVRLRDVLEEEAGAADWPVITTMPIDLQDRRRRSSASAPPAASPRCRSRRRGSTSSASRRAPGSERDDFAPDELRNNVRGWPQAVQKANREIPTHRPNASAPTSPRLAIHPMMNAVGGTTLHYWAQSWRLNPWDFKVVSETTRRYGASRIPKGSTVEDWPFGLEELEPYYDKVEYEIGVSGKAGNIKGTIDRRGNIFEGARAREYPMPPLRGTGFTDMMADAARKLGWHPFPGPAAVNTRNYQSRAGCAYHGFCARGGCHINAKGSTAVTTIPKAQATKRLSVVTEAHVTTIEVGSDGRVSGVNYIKGGTEYFQPANVVLLASYVYENVRLLLLSKSKAFPNGLSNNHGQVGRHYFSHNQIGGVTALFPKRLNNWYGLPAQGVAVDNWADDNFDHSGLDFIGGGNLWVYSDRRPIGAASMSTFGRAPRWGSAWKAFIKQNADSWNICVSAEDDAARTRTTISTSIRP